MNYFSRWVVQTDANDRSILKYSRLPARIGSTATGSLNRKAVPRQSVGHPSDHVQNDPDDRTYLTDIPLLQAHPQFRGVPNDSIQSNQKHHGHSPAHLRSETAPEARFELTTIGDR
jgi:hypothetical protein